MSTGRVQGRKASHNAAGCGRIIWRDRLPPANRPGPTRLGRVEACKSCSMQVQISSIDLVIGHSCRGPDGVVHMVNSVTPCEISGDRQSPSCEQRLRRA